MTAPLRLKRQRPTSRRQEISQIRSGRLVAAVLVDTPVSHLEGIYDYLIPENIESSAIVGASRMSSNTGARGRTAYPLELYMTTLDEASLSFPMVLVVTSACFTVW